jgi:cellobiose phosphorylase
MLVENLVQFFNVGSHNHVRLEDADWNDGLDMAKENGESVAFTSMYGANLARLADILDFNSSSAVAIAEELEILLKKTDYNSVNAKKRMLERYFDAVHPSISGRKARVSSSWLAGDLRAKSEWVLNHVRKTEWLKEGFFNGYYDNKKRRVEGAAGGRVRMMLPSQVFAIMSGAADKRQIRAIMDNAINHLFDKDLKGFRLNTDFGSEAHDLGRAFSFLYGHKENGAVFSHMAVMFAYALYSRGFAEEGWRVLSSIYRMSADTARSKIYPCLPEYFGPDGRGMYSYLTGSASWFVFTMLTQAFGVRGRAGDLLIEPRLTAGQFKDASTISVSRIFAGRRLKISFSNPEKLQWGGYRITGAKLNSRPIPVKSATPPSILSTGNTPHLLIKRDTLLHLPKERAISIDILLGK